MHLDRNTAAVVRHRDRSICVQHHIDLVAVAGEGLINRVVHDLIDEVVKAPKAYIADVHCGALANRFKAFEDLDI